MLTDPLVNSKNILDLCKPCKRSPLSASHGPADHGVEVARAEREKRSNNLYSKP